MKEEPKVSIEIGDTTGDVTAVAGDQVNAKDSEVHVGEGDTGNFLGGVWAAFLRLFQ